MKTITYDVEKLRDDVNMYISEEGLKIKDLATLVEVDPATMSKFLKDPFFISMKYIPKICEVIGKSTDEYLVVGFSKNKRLDLDEYFETLSIDDLNEWLYKIKSILNRKIDDRIENLHMEIETLNYIKEES